MINQVECCLWINFAWFEIELTFTFTCGALRFKMSILTFVNTQSALIFFPMKTIESRLGIALSDSNF